MVSEKWSATDKIFCHFGLLFVLYRPHQTPPAPSPPNNPKNQNFGKMKKLPGDIITLHMCTINDNYIMYGS